MNDELQGTLTRKQIAIRLLYTFLYAAIFMVVKTIVLLITLFEYFANKVATYAYRLMRYMTLNENLRPFPFSDFPAEIELPDEEITFD